MLKQSIYKQVNSDKQCYYSLITNYFITLSQNQSLWFRRKQFHSFAQWLTYLFEIQISDAYHKKKKYQINPFYFVNNVLTKQLIQSQIKRNITAVLAKSNKSSSNDSKDKIQQEKKYIFSQCCQRLQAQGKLIIWEYSWLQQNKSSQFTQIMDQMYKNILELFQNYLIEQEIKEIQKFENGLNKGQNKKKKNKKSKKKNNNQKQENNLENQEQQQNEVHEKIGNNFSSSKNFNEELEKKQKNEQKQSIKEQKRQKRQQIKNNQKKIEQLKDDQVISKEQSIEKRKNQNSESQNEQKSEQFTDNTRKIQSSTKRQEQKSNGYSEYQRNTTKTNQYYQKQKSQSQSQQSDYGKSKPKSKSLSKHSLVGVSMKKLDKKIQQQNKKQKLIQNILGSAFQNYAKQLIDESQKFQQTRKSSVELLREFLQLKQIKCAWQLVQFGSSEVGYSLKQSDIDIVFKIQDSKVYTLRDMQGDLKICPWVVECNYISTANVPIIRLILNLYQARKLSNRLLKKLDKAKIQNQNYLIWKQDFIVTLDISLSGLNEQYGGIVSSNNIRFLVYENQLLKKLIMILKNILRKKQLNIPYRGGINSYVLTLLTYGIIKKKEIQLSKSNKIENQYVQKKKKDYLQSLKTNLYVAFSQLCIFLKDFVAFQTLINPLQQKIDVKKDIHLNIVDPFSKKLVKTCAFRINEIIEQFQAFKVFLDQIKDGIKGEQLENKKTRFQISEKISNYINGLEQQIQPINNQENIYIH